MPKRKSSARQGEPKKAQDSQGNGKTQKKTKPPGKTTSKDDGSGSDGKSWLLPCCPCFSRHDNALLSAVKHLATATKRRFFEGCVNLRFLFSRSVSEKTAALEKSLLPQRVQVIAMGLMGSGKSTLSRALAWALGGSWVNQDEFCHLGKGAKKAFLAAVREAAAKTNSCTSGAVVVDKINTQRSHRSEIAEALGPKKDVPRVLIRFLHPGDETGQLGPCAVELGLQRIHSRGDGHRSLKSNNSKLESILKFTVDGFEPPSQNELKGFDAVLDVDMTLSQEDALAGVIEQLCRQGHIQKPGCTARQALAATVGHEAALRRCFDPLPLASGDGVASKTGKQQKKNSVDRDVEVVELRTKERRLPLYWGIFFDATSRETLTRGCDDRESTNNFVRVGDLHVTLLFAGGARDEAKVAARVGKTQVEFARLRAEYESWEGREVEVSVNRWVMSSEILCVGVVDFPDGLLCNNEHPHVTIAHSSSVRPVHSNEVLSQVATAEDTGIWPDGLKVEVIEPPLRLRGVARAEWPSSSAL